MLTVFTGLDGMGTSTIGQKVSELDEGSVLTRTPNGDLFKDRSLMDRCLRGVSPDGHMFYYLMSVIAESDRLKACYDLSTTNIYMVRYLIDTVVSNRVAGINIPYDYTVRVGGADGVYEHKILVPDLTVFVYGPEKTRLERINSRGKDSLDRVLDDPDKVRSFYNEFDKLLDPETTIYVDNSGNNPDEVAEETFEKIKTFQKTRRVPCR